MSPLDTATGGRRPLATSIRRPTLVLSRDNAHALTKPGFETLSCAWSSAGAPG